MAVARAVVLLAGANPTSGSTSYLQCVGVLIAIRLLIFATSEVIPWLAHCPDVIQILAIIATNKRIATCYWIRRWRDVALAVAAATTRAHCVICTLVERFDIEPFSDFSAK